MNLRVFIAAVLLLGLAACASPQARWTHPSASTDQRAADLSTCRRAARHDAEREFSGLTGAGSDYQRNMVLYEASKFEKRRVAGCMRRLGYTSRR